MSISAKILVLFLVSTALFALNVPLDVSNWSDVARSNENVTSGVSLPEGLISSVDNLKLTDESGNIVPTQFRPLSFWMKEKNLGRVTTPSIKWVLCDFKAKAVSPSANVRYYLQDGAGNTIPVSRVLLEEDTEKLTVSNGVVKFTVSKTKFNLFDELWFDQNGNGVYEQSEKIITTGNSNGGVITAGDWADQGCVPGTLHSTSNAAPVRVVVEENGAVKATLRIEGRHYAVSGGVTKGLYDYQVFVTTYAGSPYVDVQWGLTNLYMEGVKPAQTGTADPYKVYVWPFTEYKLVMGLNLGANQNYGILGSSEVTGTASTTEIRLLQKNGVFALTGDAGGTDALGGAVSLSDGNITVMASMRDFVPSVPKGISVKKDQIVFELFPDTGTGVKYWLDPYSRKNHRIRLQFSTGNFAAGSLVSLSKKVNTPLRMLASREWYQRCRAWYRGLGIPNATKWLRKTPAQWTRLQYTSTSQVKNLSDNNYTSINWFNIGQIGEFNGAGDHWNLTSCFFDYLMTGNPESFEYPESRALYFNDIVPVQFSWYDDPWVKLDWFLNAEDHLNGLTSYHGPTNNSIWNGTYVTFPGWAYHRSNIPDNGHMPNLQLIEYYQLTGDLATKDAITAMGARAVASVMGYCYFTANPAWVPRRPLVLDSIYVMPMQQRYIARPGIVAAHAYEVTQDERFRRCLDIVAYSLRNYTRQHPTGYMAKPDDRSYLPNTDAGVLNIWKVYHPSDTNFPRSFHANDFMIGIAQEYLYGYYALTGDKEIRDALIFSGISLEQRAGITDGTYTGFTYSGWADYLQEGRRYDKSVSATGSLLSTSYTSSMSEGMGGAMFAYLLSGRSDIRKVLYDGASYHRPESFDMKVLNMFEANYKYDSLDRVPPNKVNDLAASDVFRSGVRLTWTAPGNNGSTGKAKEYQIKYAKVPILDIPSAWDSTTKKGWPDMNGALPYTRNDLLEKARRYRDSVEISFWALPNIANNPVPSNGGVSEEFLLQGLDSLTRYYFALVAFDSNYNVSEISNVVSLVTGVGVENGSEIMQPAYLHVTPNPFNPRTAINFNVTSAEKKADVKIAIYDTKGRSIKVINRGKMSAGSHSVVWDGRDAMGNDVSSGVYTIRLTVAGKVRTISAVLSR